MQSFIGQYIEISSEEEMEKASKLLESKGYTNDFDKTYVKDKTYLFVKSNNGFHVGNGDKQSFWKPFSILYDEGMPRDEEDLLAKAKRLYPEGTRFNPAHILPTDDYFIITEDCSFEETNNYIYSTINRVGRYSIDSKYGSGTQFDRVICVKCRDGKYIWAPILNVVEEKKYEVVHYNTQEEPKFEVGKWYTEEKYFAKCHSFKGKDTMIASEWFIAGYNPGTKGTYQFCSGYTWVEATQEQLATFLPKGHPDLIVKPIEKWNVGSYVVFLTDEVKKEAEAFSKSLIPVVELQPKDIVPEYVKYINSNGWFNKGAYEIGKIYKWSDLTNGLVGKYSLSKDWSKWTRDFEISSKDEYDAQQLVSVSKPTDVKPSESKFENMSKDELLEYAKKKYPIGTKVKFPGYTERIISQELFWQYSSLISHSGCCPVLDITDGKYVWAEIIEMPKKDGYNPGYTYNEATETYKVDIPYQDLPKETHQSINKTGKQFSPIKVELIKVKQLKIN